MPAQPPSAISARCPECGKEGIHTVLHGTMGSRGAALTIDATVKCESCGHTHHALVKEAKDVDIPIIMSQGGKSVKSRLRLPGGEVVRIDDPLIVDGIDTRVTGIESKDGKRVEAAMFNEVKTLWTKRFDMVEVGFAINLDKKTITKSLTVEPTVEFSVGQEFVFGRLRVTIHGIKIKERMLKRGSAEAGDITRVFAKPTPLARHEHRPDKRTREQLRQKEERRARK
jgi:uncharacterized Zn finger protein